VVLGTTLVTPVLLRRRYDRLAARPRPAESGGPALRHRAPPGGWVQIVDGRIALAAIPDRGSAADAAFIAARYVATARPDDSLLDGFAPTRSEPLGWSPTTTRAFVDLLAVGTARSWRLLEALDVLPRAFPELAGDLQKRHDDPFRLDPMRLHRWETLERLAVVRSAPPGRTQWNDLVFPERVLLAAFLIDVIGSRTDALGTTRQFLNRLQLGSAAEHEIATLVFEPDLMVGLATHDGSHDHVAVLRLAAHLRTPETARASFVVALARGDLDAAMLARLTDLHELVQQILADPDTGPEAEHLAARRRAEASQLVTSDSALAFVELAPREYVLSQDPSVIARHALALSRWRDEERSPKLFVSSTETDESDGWWLDVVADDVHGLLARVASVLGVEDLDVSRAIAVSWPDGPALESFLVHGAERPDVKHLRGMVEAATHAPLTTHPVTDADLAFDDTVSPWYTICELDAPDAPGLLAAVAAAFAAAGVDVHGSTVATVSGRAQDRFELSWGGTRLAPDVRAQVRQNLSRGVTLEGARRFRHRLGDSVRIVMSSVFSHQPVSESTSPSH